MQGDEAIGVNHREADWSLWTELVAVQGELQEASAVVEYTRAPGIGAGRGVHKLEARGLSAAGAGQ